MAELADFVRSNAGKITPQIVRGLHKRLSLMRLKFSQIDAPNYPHLPGQLEFLAQLVEDFVDGKIDDLPFCTMTYAAFALIYAHRENDIIPDSVPDIGMSDDSGVVRVVLIEHEKVLSEYAKGRCLNWDRISTGP